MKKYRVVYLRLAQKDLIDIFDYIRADNPSAARRFLSSIDSCISHLTMFPHKGVVPRDDTLAKRGYRILILGDYLVFYLTVGRKIEIRRIIHGKRRYAFLLREEEKE